MTNNREEKPKQIGGYRPGAGRKYKGVPTEKIRINKTVSEKLKSHVDWLVKTGGKFISQQDYSSKAILKYASSLSKDESLIQELAADITPSSAPWGTLTITQEAYKELENLVTKIEPITPVYTNLSNVFTVIILKEIKTQKKMLSSSKSKLQS
ncbi:hypothetical protein COO91_03446 [Nostoc flagelliforme CCNUN1]|uniref:Uncharacterized protein n=1 Tax=Nostoc flagelliforme CCNUN1 TaxID=2038116 RepID=A0A2K8SPY9_9NOSO|nr:hypothetical protein [Nostoc flagelliforme]AUB37501.1 hypothetical protein COO91_03446 [Nostoc flagelliforme CCNUN1]